MWDELVLKKKFESKLENADQFARARLKAAASPRSGSWLNALLVLAIGNRLEDESFRVGIGLRTGARLCEPHTCRGGANIDAFARHPLSCRFNEGRIPRHSALNDVFKRVLSTAGFTSLLKPVGLDRADGKRPDGMTTFPYKQGKCLVWDITVVDTYATSNVIDSAIESSSATNRAESLKFEKYRYLQGRYIFEGLAFETTGARGSNAERVISDVARLVCSKTAEKRQKSWFYERISLAIVRGNAQSILSSSKN